MVNIVTIDNKKYMVDVGFGSNSPVFPIPLQDGIELEGIPPTRVRLEYKNLPNKHTNPSQKVWVYSTRDSDDREWKEQYCFVEVEFFPADFEVMNLSTSTARHSFFIQSVMAVRFIPNEVDDGLDGAWILFDDYVKKRWREKSEIIEKLETEEDRVKALKKYFAVELTPVEQRAIMGLSSALTKKNNTV